MLLRRDDAFSGRLSVRLKKRHWLTERATVSIAHDAESLCEKAMNCAIHDDQILIVAILGRNAFGRLNLRLAALTQWFYAYILWSRIDEVFCFFFNRIIFQGERVHEIEIHQQMPQCRFRQCRYGRSDYFGGDQLLYRQKPA